MAESWRLTEQEKRGARDSAASALSSFLGPIGAIAMWGFDYLYDRRDLIFGTGGVPTQAVAADGSLVSLSALGQAEGQQSAPLTIVINLDPSALNLGLKNGDPVSVVVTGHSYTQPRSGLVVPAQVGEPVTVAIPRGSYSVGAFGSSQKSLFTASDPYQAVGGSSTPLLSGHRELAVPLTARAPLIRMSARTPRTLGVPLGNRLLSPPALNTCIKCGQPIDTGTALLEHMLTCQGRPARTWVSPDVARPAVNRFAVARVANPGMPDSFILPTFRCHECSALFYSQQALDDHLAAPHQCDRCFQRFTTSEDLNSHFATMHPIANWWRGLW